MGYRCGEVNPKRQWTFDADPNNPTNGRRAVALAGLICEPAPRWVGAKIRNCRKGYVDRRPDFPYIDKSKLHGHCVLSAIIPAAVCMATGSRSFAAGFGAAPDRSPKQPP